MKKLLLSLTLISLLSGTALTALMFLPHHHNTHAFTIHKGQGISTIAQQLHQHDLIFSRYVFQLVARLKQLNPKPGQYSLPTPVSTWQLIPLLQQRPATTQVRIIEGMKFAQMRQIIHDNPDLDHQTVHLSDQQLLQAIDPHIKTTHPEGLFFPDSYQAERGSSDLAIFQAAYRAMQQQLDRAWRNRQTDLPYKSPYELLIMASIIEKETAHPDDRVHVSAVFRNRLHKGMRLQTDPTVIYGMGEKYQGNIRRSDLEHDTPYNTYTRAGLTPTPIALPGAAALHAAAHPSEQRYLYFVAKMDGTGKSQFSHTLDEHNAAVRQYLLKK